MRVLFDNHLRPIEIFLGRAHLNRNPRQLDHLTRAMADNMHAQNTPSVFRDDDFHQHLFVATRSRIGHRAEGGAVNFNLACLTRLFFAQTDSADLWLGEDCRRDVGMVWLGRALSVQG